MPVYHVSRATNRDLILQEGICPHNIHGRTQEFDWLSGKDHVYFWDNLEDAKQWKNGYHGLTSDIWEAEPPTVCEPDPNLGDTRGAYRTPVILKPIAIVQE